MNYKPDFDPPGEITARYTSTSFASPSSTRIAKREDTLNEAFNRLETMRAKMRR